MKAVVILGTVILTAFVSIFNGLVLSILWTWFMVPVFGLPHLSIVYAIGISLIIGYLMPDKENTSDDEKDKDDLSESIIRDARILLRSFIRALATLAIGFIIYLFT